MSSSLEQLVGQRLMLAFPTPGPLTEEIRNTLGELRPAGITLFRSLNIENPSQLRSLTDEFQATARRLRLPPFLIGADQEGGQLMAVGSGTTSLPGNMALGAAGSPELAYQAGEVLGRELAAMGINVNYAPCCDINLNPQNPVVGIRSFGEDPHAVGKLSRAMVAGIQSTGVASTAKHFPGHGDTSADSHHGLPTLPHSIERLRQIELVPFEDAIQAGVKMVMTAHIALPAVDGPEAPPATLSPAILKGLLRDELGFGGVIITDAMDMQAISQGQALGESVIRAAEAGADLILMTSNSDDQRLALNHILQACKSNRLHRGEMETSVRRVLELKEWLKAGALQPDLTVVGCADHQRIAQEIATRSITLVRDQARLLPLQPRPGDRLAVILPQPVNLTPADTSSYVVPQLTAAIRSYYPDLDEMVVPFAPAEGDIKHVLERLPNYNLVILCTLNAFHQTGQQALVSEVLRTGIPVVLVAVRLPYDLAAFPEAPTYVCTYSILEPSMQALAKTLFGRSVFRGRLPVSIPGLYPVGHGLTA